MLKLARREYVRSYQRKNNGKSVRVREHVRTQPSAIGLPDRNKIDKIPNAPGMWDVGVQLHDAKRAGRHYDLRLSDGKVAHSWALKYLPEPGEARLAIRQPSHTPEYMPWEGDIPEGYGAGTVKSLLFGKAEVIDSGDSQVTFNIFKGKSATEYVLLKMEKDWLLINRSTTRGKYNLPRGKASYKSLPLSSDLAKEEGEMHPKIDGAHGLILLERGKRPRVFSHREPKKEEELEYTHKIPGLFSTKIPIDKKRLIVRGEVYLSDKAGNPLPAERTAAVLNSSIERARELQKGTGGLRIYPFHIDGLPREEGAKILQSLHGLSPVFDKPKPAHSEKEKAALILSIQNKTNRVTKEGVVMWKNEEVYKAKVSEDTDVYLRGLFEGEGKYKDHAGGFYYSTTPDGPIVGKTGGGLSDRERKILWNRRKDVKGLVATIKFDKMTEGGGLYAPRFLRWHPDKSES